MIDECIQLVIFVLGFIGILVIPCAIFEWRMSKHHREWIRELRALQDGRAKQAEAHGKKTDT